MTPTTEQPASGSTYYTGAYSATTPLAPTYPQTRASSTPALRTGAVGTLFFASLLAVGLTTLHSSSHDQLSLNTRIQIPNPTQTAPARPWSLTTGPVAQQLRPPATVASPVGASADRHGLLEAAAPAGPVPKVLQDLGLKLPSSPQLPSAPAVSAAVWVWLARFSCTLSALALFMSTRGASADPDRTIAMAAVSGDNEPPQVPLPPKPSLTGRLFLSKKEKEDRAILAAMEKDAKEEKLREAALKKWRNAALFLVLFYLGCCVFNAIVLALLHQTSGSLHLSEEAISKVAMGLADAEREMRYDSMMGRGPTLSEEDLMGALRTVGENLEEEQMEEMLEHSANCLSDSIVAVMVILGVIFNKDKVQSTFSDYTNKFMGLGNVTQAFTLLLVTDMFCGFHSADGWDTALKLAGEHYGIMGETYEDLIRVWIATVPVGLDVAFKFWVFKKLRTLAPATQALLEEIE